jgi:hypothetical protein
MRFVNTVSGRFRARVLPRRQCQHQTSVAMAPRPAGADLLELGPLTRPSLVGECDGLEGRGVPRPGEEGGRTYEFEPLLRRGSRRPRICRSAQCP